MKYILFLLAMVGAVRGAHLLAKIQGVSNGTDPCPVDVQEDLYNECVVNKADSMGFNHTRRLELSGNRELITVNQCDACAAQPEYDYKGSLCWYCENILNTRRLTVAGEHVHTERFLSEKGELEVAAVECLREKGLTCLGNPDTITVTIVLSDPVDLGAACNYAVLAKTGISTVPNSVITGDIGVSSSSITSADITGFALVLDSSGNFSTSSQVVGNVYAPDYTAMEAGKAHAPDYSDSTPADAVSAMEVAYANVAKRTATGSSWKNIGGSGTPGTSTIGGLSLMPGVYTFTAAVSINSDLTFRGSAEDIFVIQTTGVTQAANTHVILEGGAQAKNIFWQVAGDVAIGAGASMQGILLVQKKVDFITGSSLVGRVLAQTAVNLQMANITGTTCD